MISSTSHSPIENLEYARSSHSNKNPLVVGILASIASFDESCLDGLTSAYCLKKDLAEATYFQAEIQYSLAAHGLANIHTDDIAPIEFC